LTSRIRPRQPTWRPFRWWPARYPGARGARRGTLFLPRARRSRSASPAVWRRRRCGKPGRSRATMAPSPTRGRPSSAHSAPARIGLDGGDRSWARTHAKSMQRQDCL